MSKIKTSIVGAIVITVAVTGVVEVRANRELRAESRASRAGDDEITRLQRENRQLNDAMTKLGAGNPEIAELTRLRNRLSAVKARPDGVVEAEIRPPQIAGARRRSGDGDILLGIERQDLDLVGGFINFSDDTPGESRGVHGEFQRPGAAPATARRNACAPRRSSVSGIRIRIPGRGCRSSAWTRTTVPIR